jgi:hypothetical protein
MNAPTEKEINRRAFELWEKAGCPEGKDKEFCRQAEWELRNEEEESNPSRKDWCAHSMKTCCPVCFGIGWVCETHPDKASDDELGCTCSEGMPSECDDSDLPDTSQVIVIEDETVR